MLDISYLLLAPDFTTSFELLEQTTEFIDGEYVAGTPKISIMRGTVRPTSDKDLEMLPETDRVSGTTTFWVKGRVELNINETLPPLLRYKGLTYKATHVLDWSDSGFTKIIATLQGRGG